MEVTDVLDIAREGVFVMLKVSAPLMITALVVGLAVSLFQALTQIQEMTLVFVPKIVAVLGVLIAALPWMLSLLMTFTHNLFVNIPAYVR